MIKTKERTINKRLWQVTQWSGSKNLDVIFRLTTAIGPALAHGVKGKPSKNMMEAEINAGAAADALFRGLGSSEDFKSLVMLLMSGVHVERRTMSDQDNFDEAFAGEGFADLLPGLAFVIETNFGGFQGAAKTITSLFAATQKAPGTETDSPES